MRLERDTLALAAFVSRPQAEAQIGANRIEIYNVIRSLSIKNVGWAEPGEAQRPKPQHVCVLSAGNGRHTAELIQTPSATTEARR